MNKIRKLLEKEGINFVQREDYLLIPYKIGELKFHITITIKTKWVVISAIIASFDEIPKGVELELYRNLLLANHNLPEINYEIDEEGNIINSADMEKDIINYENFFSEFNAIPYGIKYFLDIIAPPLKISVSGQE